MFDGLLEGSGYSQDDGLDDTEDGAWEEREREACHCELWWGACGRVLLDVLVVDTEEKESLVVRGLGLVLIGFRRRTLRRRKRLCCVTWWFDGG